MPSGHVALVLPRSFAFRHRGVYDFEPVLGFFDWDLHDTAVIVDLSKCTHADYQALSLLVLFLWHLRTRSCHVRLEVGGVAAQQSAGAMWRRMGAAGWDHVLWEQGDQFRGNRFKPLLAIRDKLDFDAALSGIANYTGSSNIEYEKTLHYIVSEILYNTMEHGQRSFQTQGGRRALPSILQFSWYKNRNELQIIVADLGVGVKRHLESAYPPFESHVAALRKAIQPQVSGTFGPQNGYTSGKNNAGVGLYISTGKDAARRAERFAVSMENYFGRYAENKVEAIDFRDKHLLPAIEAGKEISLDFSHVDLSTHSFLSALLATPIARLGMAAFKKIRITNASPEIRETIDYILDENTRAD